MVNSNWRSALLWSTITAVLVTTCGPVGTPGPSASTSGSSPSPGLGNTLVINTNGGSLDDVRKKIWYDPFTTATGVRVVLVSPVDNAKLKTMVTSGFVEFDLVASESISFGSNIREGLLEKLDLSQLPLSDLP